ncbi:MAG: CHAT domain-containing protein [Cyanobacteria bacterium P01_F01_bin.150]
MNDRLTRLQRFPLFQKRLFRLLALACIGCLLAVSFSLLYPWLPSQAVDDLTPLELNSALSAEELLQAGIEYFETNDLEDAIRTWQEALNYPNLNNQDFTRALILSNLSLASQHLGALEQAEMHIAQSLAIFEQHNQSTWSPTDWEYYAKALNTQGWLQWRQGQPESALTTWKDTTYAYKQAHHLPGIVGSQINQAKVLQALGLSTEALQQLRTLETVLEQETNPTLQIKGLRHLGNALRRVGELEQSEKILQQALGILVSENASDTNTVVVASPTLKSSLFLDLGNTQRAQWERATALKLNPEQNEYQTIALKSYQDSITNASTKLQTLQAQANLLGLLINIYKSQQTELNLTTDSFTSNIDSQIINQWDQINSNFQNADFRDLLLSQPGLEVKLNVINSLIKFRSAAAEQGNQDSLITWQDIETQLEQTLKHAQSLDDKRSESLSLGYLGHIYEKQEEWSKAKQLTDEAIKAIALTKNLNAPDIEYRWIWQLGRIFQHYAPPHTAECYQKTQSEGSGGPSKEILYTDNALCSYELAVNLLDDVRNNFLFIKSNVQFSFRDNVEPLYREYVDLLLQHPTRNADQLKKHLGKATALIDALQLAELENFLGCNIDPIPLAQKVVDPEAAILYPVILQDRLEVILALPNPEDTRKQRFYQFPARDISKDKIEEIISGLRSDLARPKSRDKDRLQKATQLYEWLIRPVKDEINAFKAVETGKTIQTLAFVLDGNLRNLPMSALWDQEKEEYLLDQYAIAVSPSMQLVDPQKMSHPIRVLAAGTTEALDHPLKPIKFTALQNVKAELETIDSLLRTEILLDSNFTQPNLATKIQEGVFSIVHIATHGVFSSEPSRTFIAISNGEGSDLTDNTPVPEDAQVVTRGDDSADDLATQNEQTDKQANEQPNALFANELDALLRDRSIDSRPIDLLVLSACTTAQGDNRATLGIAGLSVRAGARSTLATLWSVYDEPAAMLMQLFYQQLAEQPDISRSQALQQAQLQLRAQPRFEHPSYWSSYIVVGNWL